MSTAVSEGTLLDERYRLDRIIGRGGMADVYAADDVLLDRRVAVKIPLTPFRDDDRFARRFAKEARAAAALTHPNIVSVYDRGDDGDVSYIVMELVEGDSLRHLIDSRGFTEAESLRIVRDVCGALDYAHSRGFVHRDLKPDNVMIDREGVVKVTDFGIVRAVGERTITSTRPLGSVAYVSPEQATGRTVDERSDLYSVGIVAYELLTGSRPFTAESPIAIALAHIETPPTPVRELVPTISAEAAAVVERALEKSPEQRFQRAHEMRDAVHRALRGQTATQAIPPGIDLDDVEVTSPDPVIALDTDQVRRVAEIDPDASTVPPYRLEPSVEPERDPRAARPLAPPTRPADPEPRPVVDDRVRSSMWPGHDRPTGPVDPTWNWNRQRLTLAAVAAFALIVLTGLFPSGGDVTVPDLVGLDATTARQVVAGRDLGLHIADYDPDADATAGAVIATDPPAGSRVPRGEAVAAVVAGTP